MYKGLVFYAANGTGKNDFMKSLDEINKECGKIISVSHNSNNNSMYIVYEIPDSMG